MEPNAQKDDPADGTPTNNDNSDNDKTPEITNAAAKALPWVRDMVKELGEYKRREIERTAAETASKAEKEAKELEAKQQYEAAAQKRVDAALAVEREKLAKEHSAKERQLEAKAALAMAGFKNQKFIRMTVGELGEDEDINAFVKRIIEEPESAPFLLATSENKSAFSAPPRSNNSSVIFTKEKLTDWSEAMKADGTPDKEKQAAAIKYKRDYWDKHKSLPFT